MPKLPCPKAPTAAVDRVRCPNPLLGRKREARKRVQDRAAGAWGIFLFCSGLCVYAVSVYVVARQNGRVRREMEMEMGVFRRRSVATLLCWHAHDYGHVMEALLGFRGVA